MDDEEPSDESMDKFGIERIITDWINTIEDFRMLYVKLVALIPDHSEKLISPVYIGQCPAESLVTLVLSMQKELELLLEEMEELDRFTQKKSPHTFRKLVWHTQRLNKLIEKAQVRLQLVNDSSS